MSRCQRRRPTPPRASPRRPCQPWRRPAAVAAAAAAAAAAPPAPAMPPAGAALPSQLTDMLAMLGQFAMPQMGAMPSQAMPGAAPHTPGDEAGANGKRVIYRQRLTNEQVGQLTQIAEAAEWSLLRIPRAQREALSTQVGVTVGQLKNFFSNAKPKDRKKSLGKRKEDEP
mmetsp:Transcript_38619/g.100342  ORF Transcript_38619/g.100342 Transcript_38619/m.100342 type:complete len:170 (+) Transcript_38619:281-790(+)